MESILKHIDDNKELFLEQWFEILRIPSISAKKEHKADIEKTADWLVNFLSEKLGLSARVIKTRSNPLVYAESPKIANAPTVLVYGHSTFNLPSHLKNGSPILLNLLFGMAKYTVVALTTIRDS